MYEKRVKWTPSSRGSGFWPFVTTFGTAVGETVKRTTHDSPCRTSGTLSSSVAVGATLARATCRPSTERDHAWSAS